MWLPLDNLGGIKVCREKLNTKGWNDLMTQTQCQIISMGVDEKKEATLIHDDTRCQLILDNCSS